MITVHRLLSCVTITLCLANAHAEESVVTRADIPADVSQELKGLLERTFVGGFHASRSRAEDGDMGEDAVPAVPFLVRLLGDDAYAYSGLGVCDEAGTQLVRIGDPRLRHVFLPARLLQTW